MRAERIVERFAERFGLLGSRDRHKGTGLIVRVGFAAAAGQGFLVRQQGDRVVRPDHSSCWRF